MSKPSNPDFAEPAQRNFNGKTALLFGGAKGIGKSVAQEWARRGARMAIADIDAEAADETARAIVEAGGSALPIKADVTETSSVEQAFAEATAALGEPDIVMANVGAIVNGHPQDIPFAEWQRIFELNYWGALRIIQHALPAFLARKAGHIVTTASFAGLYPYAASRVPYASAKAAVISLSEQLALYCEPQGIRVTCLIPGPVMTGVMDTMTTWTQDCPMRGPGSELELMLPQDVATVLADAMEAGAILVPSDRKAFDIVRRWADDPDGFIRGKIAEFERGERGAPQVPDHIRQMLASSR